jgi:hypothetical protein
LAEQRTALRQGTKLPAEHLAQFRDAQLRIQEAVAGNVQASAKPKGGLIERMQRRWQGDSKYEQRQLAEGPADAKALLGLAPVQADDAVGVLAKARVAGASSHPEPLGAQEPAAQLALVDRALCGELDDAPGAELELLGVGELCAEPADGRVESIVAARGQIDLGEQCLDALRLFGRRAEEVERIDVPRAFPERVERALAVEHLPDPEDRPAGDGEEERVEAEGAGAARVLEEADPPAGEEALLPVAGEEGREAGEGEERDPFGPDSFPKPYLPGENESEEEAEGSV